MKRQNTILFVILAAVLISGNCNAQWHQSTLPLSDNITDILQYGNIWYVATSNNGIQRTQDFTLWSSSSAGIGTSDIRRIITSLEGSNIVLYASTANGVYRSAMLGYNWSAVNNGLTSLNVGDMFSDGTILLASTADGVFRSVNYGQSWSSVSIGSAGQSVRCFLKNGTDILAGMANPGNYLYRSTDNGLTWSPYGTGLYEVYQLAKLDDELFASSGTLMYHSTDNGLTWLPASSGLVPGMNIMDMTTQGDYLYVATLAGGYVQHTDSSRFIIITNGMPQGGYMSNSIAANNNNVVIGTLFNGLWYADPGVITSTVNPEKGELRLYPNPAGDQCVVSVAGWQGKECSVAVIDFSGRKVMNVIDGVASANGIEINISSLPQGIYYVKIALENQTIVKKIIKL